MNKRAFLVGSLVFKTDRAVADYIRGALSVYAFDDGRASHSFEVVSGSLNADHSAFITADGREIALTYDEGLLVVAE